PAPTPVSPSPSLATPSPTQPPAPELPLSLTAVNVVATATPAPASSEIGATRDVITNLTYLPIGITYVLGAPFPWTVRTLGDLATLPDTLLWYACAVLALVGLLDLVRRRDYRYVYGLIMLGGVGLVLSLAEGNVGTLVRHRAMLIPEVVVLASVGILA